MTKINPFSLWKVLYIVEWPNKFKTFRELMKKWDIPTWDMWATFWHIYEIDWEVRWKAIWLWIDIENDFKVSYRVAKERKDNLKELEKQIANADKVFIMTDDDYEWEVIAYSLYDYFKKHSHKFLRTPFTEIEKKSILTSIENATASYRENKMLAWRSRAILDRIIGWGYSPLVRKYSNLNQVSAWRVQSPSLGIITEREKEIVWHSSTNYYSIIAEHKNLSGSSIHILSKQKDENGNFHLTYEETEKILEKIRNCKEASVLSYEEGKRERKPQAPFKMSSLLSEGWNILKMSAEEIWKIGNENVDFGLNSYIRTDSVVLKPDTIASIREYIEANIWKEYLASEVIEYKNWKSAQEWHSWIAPVDINKKNVAKNYSKKHFDLYNLIWKRAIASQMSNAVYQTQKMVLNVDWEEFIIKWEKCIFKWFLEVWNFNEIDETSWEEIISEEFWFPAFKKWEIIKIDKIKVEEHKSKPKGRYNETSLIKHLEKNGVGRPSTYSSIFKALEEKWMVEIDKKKRSFKLTEKWKAVEEALKQFAYKDIMNIEFTQKVEDERDEFGKLEWEALRKAYLEHLTKFYNAISETMKEWWVEFKDWFATYIKWEWNFIDVNKKYSNVLDPHWNLLDEYLIEKTTKEWKIFLISEISWNLYSKYLRVLVDEKCWGCGSVLCMEKSKEMVDFKMCCSSRNKENKCEFDNSWETINQNCKLCKKPIILKKTSKWDVLCCSDKTCSYFLFLWENWSGLNYSEDMNCPVCNWATVDKKAWSWYRRDCIHRTYNAKTKKNEGCSWQGMWLND